MLESEAVAVWSVSKMVIHMTRFTLSVISETEIAFKAAYIEFDYFMLVLVELCLEKIVCSTFLQSFINNPSSEVLKI